ncbi:MAG TPA: rod shape-determining protein RodA [Candidatus Saccharicenans sp.]|jgi:rod shape determining protein RodA|nr:rod shape-determining protein RodA [Candidatus Saccharicenans sp.]HQO75965.1 rod shape-determining protein RodA [Candidatus Saccharicenans sp.]HUM79132.1 rod shape-determining protein RodA [Candidatus Saccharicenans sp.]
MLDRRIFKEIDWTTILLMVLIAVIGIIFVHSAIYYQASKYVWKQSVWLVVSSLALLILLIIDYKVLLSFALPFYILMNIILAGLLIFGKTVANTRSWLVFGPFQFQPSELTKLAVILLLARLFSDYKEDKMSFKAFFLSSAIVGLPFLLIALQPDLGTALTLVPILLGTYILAGLPKKYLVVILIISCLFGFIGWNYGLKDYQKKRIETLLVPDRDPRGAGYQLQQSRIALGSGGLTGKGYHKGTQSQLRFLPARHNDFILAVIGEDLGFLGILGVFLIYFIFLYRLFSAVQVSPDRGGVYIAFLSAMLIGCQFMINVMMIIGLFPITGIPIPFLSYGGSSLLTNFLIVGLVINVKMRRFAYVRL